MDMWNAPMVQSRKTDLQVDGKSGPPVWAWEAQGDMEAAVREGLQTVEALGHRPSS